MSSDQEWTKEDYKNIAKQLRKPEGEYGQKLAGFMNEGNLPMNLHTLAALNPEGNDNILEIGMANGNFVKNILNLNPSISYTGCDYSEEMVELAIGNNQTFVEENRAKFVRASVLDLPLETDSFHKIFTINTFYFWDDFPKAMAELHRVLKPTGELLIAIRPKHNLVNFPATEFGFSLISEEEIIEMFVANGFEFKEVTKIQEPNRFFMGKMQEKENVIFNFTINPIN